MLNYTRYFFVISSFFNLISSPEDRLKNQVNYKLTDRYLVSAQLYKDYLSNFVIVTADIILFNPDMSKVLVFKRKSEPLKGGLWGPGGRMLKHETLIMTAHRVLKDEVGLDSIELLYVMPMSSNFKKCDGSTKSAEINFFYAIVEEDAISRFNITDGQHEKAFWVSVDDSRLSVPFKEGIRRAKIVNSNRVHEEPFFEIEDGCWFADSRVFFDLEKINLNINKIDSKVIPPL